MHHASCAHFRGLVNLALICMLFSVHCTVHMARYILCTSHFTSCTLHMLHTSPCTLCTFIFGFVQTGPFPRTEKWRSTL